MVKNPIAALVVVALALAGCSKAVQITAPTSSPLTAPLTAFTVKFSPFFAPGSFSAQLDGGDVTAGFVPVAAPGGTSKMNLPDTCDMPLTGGTQVVGGPQGRDTSPVVIGSGTSGGRPGTPMATPATGGGGPGGGGGSAGPAAPITGVFSHQLHVSGQCNGLICETTDDFVFVPLHLVGNPATLDLKIGQPPVLARVETFPKPSSPIPVCVRPLLPSVTLNGQANTIVVMTGTTFTIAAKKTGGLQLSLEAAGVQMGSIQGTVNQ